MAYLSVSFQNLNKEILSILVLANSLRSVVDKACPQMG